MSDLNDFHFEGPAGTRTERFFAQSEEGLGVMKAWAESANLPCSIVELSEPVNFRNVSYGFGLDIGPIKMADSALYEALDNAEDMFGFIAGNEGSFKIKEDPKNANGRFAKQNAA